MKYLNFVILFYLFGAPLNHPCFFSSVQIRDCALDVQVMDFDTVGRNELIGKVLLACE